MGAGLALSFITWCGLLRVCYAQGSQSLSAGDVHEGAFSSKKKGEVLRRQQ